jgi:hypothetical protein
MTDAAWVAVLLACICFALAAFGVTFGRVQVGWLGLFILSVCVVLAGLPAGVS